MKNKSVKTSKMQKGFAMLEVMLAVLIIAVASFGIYKLYSASSTRNSVAAVSTQFNQLASAVTRYSNTFMKQPEGIAEVINAGYLPRDYATCTSSSTCTLTSTFGLVTYTKGTTTLDSFKLDLKSVPASSVNDLAKDMSVTADVKINNEPYSGNGADAVVTTAQPMSFEFPKTTS